MFKLNTRTLVMCAICVAIAVVLQQIPAFRLPQGGSLTLCSMLFITLAGYWFGPAIGALTGIVLGLLDLLLGGYYFHPVQVVLDYPVAFAMLGLAGGCFKNIKYGLPVGYLAGVFGRFCMHVISGVVFFAEYAPETQHVLVYSSIYNISYIWTEALLTMIIIGVPAFRKAIDRVGSIS
jgi:thiamine transporter